MAKQFKVNRTLKYKISIDAELCKYNTPFAYIANQSSDEAELNELQSHLKNIKYYINFYNTSSCALVYNGVTIKVYKFSLTFDSIEIYLMKKYYESSTKQFNQIYNLYKSLDSDYKNLLRSTNKNYDKIINSLEGVINHEIATETVNEGIDKLLNEAKIKSEIVVAKFLSIFCSIGFISLSFLSGANYSSTNFSLPLFLMILLIAIGYGYLAIIFIIKLYELKENARNI